jgi:hypothetical protein
MLGHWAGIKCVNGSVIAITLPWRGLGSSLYDRVGQLVGLRRLSIHNNAIAGAIPAALGFLPKLIRLNLSHNYVSGEVPAQVVASPLILFLDLSYNRIVRRRLQSALGLLLPRRRVGILGRRIRLSYVGQRQLTRRPKAAGIGGLPGSRRGSPGRETLK